MEILKEKKSKFIWSWAISNLLDSLIVEYGCISFLFSPTRTHKIPNHTVY